MKYALFRLVSISFISLIVTCGALFGLRLIGLSQNHAALKHPILDDNVSFSFHEFSPSLQKSLPEAKHKMLSVNLWVSKDLGFVLFNKTGQLSENTYVFNSSTSDLLDKGATVFSQFLKNNQNKTVLLNIYEQDPAKLFHFAKLIKAHNFDKKIIIQSPFPETLKYLRKQNPLWLFGSHLSLQTQLMFLSALYIEPIAKISADFIVTPFKYNKVPLLNARIAKELKRRSIRLILVQKAQNLELPSWLNPDGFLR
jgi:hypothetical protein